MTQPITLLFLLLTALTLAQGRLYSVVAVVSSGARYHLNDLYDGG